MEQGYTKNDFLTETQPVNVKELYHQYADKLLGYVLAIVNNRPLAENVLVKIFTDIASGNHALFTGNFSTTWNTLTTIARHEINFANSADECKTVTENTAYIEGHKYLIKMSDIQRLAFCGIYYHRKSTAKLASESGVSEQRLRSALKEAFTIIREVRDED